MTLLRSKEMDAFFRLPRRCGDDPYAAAAYWREG